MIARRLILIAAFLAAALTPIVALPARSGPAELGLLTSYIGNWNGEGVLVGGEAPEAFTCRLNITKGNQTKINYAGRCHLINMNLSVSGTIAFNDSSRRYEAAMSSNAGFTGIAVGRQQGDNVTFHLTEEEVDRGGNVVRIGADIHLVNGKITVDFEVEFNESGQVLTASVPFSR